MRFIEHEQDAPQRSIDEGSTPLDIAHILPSQMAVAMTFSRVVLARDIDLTPYESATVSAHLRLAEGGRGASPDAVAVDVVSDWSPVDDSGGVPVRALDEPKTADGKRPLPFFQPYPGGEEQAVALHKTFAPIVAPPPRLEAVPPELLILEDPDVVPVAAEWG